MPSFWAAAHLVVFWNSYVALMMRQAGQPFKSMMVDILGEGSFRVHFDGKGRKRSGKLKHQDEAFSSVHHYSLGRERSILGYIRRTRHHQSDRPMAPPDDVLLERSLQASYFSLL